MKKKNEENLNFRSVTRIAFAAVLLCFGSYFLITALFPFLQSAFTDPKNNETIQKLAETEEKITENRLFIPKIDINLPYATGDEAVMESGAWWRAPSSGNPRDGGNFVLSAHRFVMGWTPGETVKRSPFYDINRLDIGDTITIDYESKRYTYKVKEMYLVAPTAVEIEEPTEDARLTLYSCGLGGANDRREVVIAALNQ